MAQQQGRGGAVGSGCEALKRAEILLLFVPSCVTFKNCF